MTLNVTAMVTVLGASLIVMEGMGEARDTQKSGEERGRSASARFVISQSCYQNLLAAGGLPHDFTRKCIEAPAAIYKDLFPNTRPAVEISDGYFTCEGTTREAADQVRRAKELARVARDRGTDIVQLRLDDPTIRRLGGGAQSEVLPVYRAKLELARVLGCQQVVMYLDTDIRPAQVGDVVDVLKQLCVDARGGANDGSIKEAQMWILLEPQPYLRGGAQTVLSVVRGVRDRDHPSGARAAGERQVRAASESSKVAIDNLGILLNLSASAEDPGQVWREMRRYVKSVAIETYRFENGGKRESNRDYAKIFASGPRRGEPGSAFTGEVVFRYLGPGKVDNGIRNSKTLFDECVRR
jgi:hypothetical protein